MHSQCRTLATSVIFGDENDSVTEKKITADNIGL